jgi:hypothetical protein
MTARCSGLVQVWHIVALSLFLGTVNAFDIPSRQSFLIEMIEKREDLGNAIALNSSMVNGTRLVGPSLAGIVIAAFGEGICFLLNAVSFLAVIAALAAMRVKVGAARAARTSVLHELREGLSYAYHFPPIRSILLLLALVSLVGVPYTVLLPVFARDVLHGGANTFGFLMAAAGWARSSPPSCLHRVRPWWASAGSFPLPQARSASRSPLFRSRVRSGFRSCCCSLPASA